MYAENNFSITLIVIEILLISFDFWKNIKVKNNKKTLNETLQSLDKRVKQLEDRNS